MYGIRAKKIIDTVYYVQFIKIHYSENESDLAIL